jgi:hypothetical protein
MIQYWRLSEAGEDNLGLAFTEEGLFLGRTPLVERRGDQFVVRERAEVARLLRRAYRAEPPADCFMSGLGSVARALNTNDACLARIYAVHLRIPDLPNRAARSDMEAEDRVIKALEEEGDANWNPALHPRTGTPPNPGWFASTDSANDATPPIRIAQNANPKQHSDTTTHSDDWVRLPPGQRNDELADLLEWIANAKPGEAQAIRAEIKRKYYDTGDNIGGGALMGALNDVLESGTTKKIRQEILNQIEPYAHTEPGRGQLGTLLDLTVRGVPIFMLGMVPVGAAAESAAAAWELGWAARGLYFSERLGANLPVNFPVVDKWLSGVATSIKSIDLSAATYQNAANLMYRLNSYINKLATFDGASLGIWRIQSTAIKSRVLSIVVREGSMSAEQKAVIEAARLRAKVFDIDLIVTGL